ncbi:MAG: hypothetical protein ACJ74H_02040 [Thermoanaerobaculia bacterium]
MNAQSKLRLRVWDPAEGCVTEVPLAGDGLGGATVELRCLAGASGIHVVVKDKDTVRLRAEINAEPGELVPLHMQFDEPAGLQLRSPGRDVVLLPPDDRYDPVMPIRPATAAPLDIAIVIDGTLRRWPEGGAVLAQNTRVLDDENFWSEQVERLLSLIEALANGRETRLAVLAFGDQDPPTVTAPDLRPRYRLLHGEDQRILQPFDAKRGREQLLSIPSTPGGDFVDALADALEACGQLHWRTSARKLVIVVGDSPGCSLLHPLPKGADLCIRERDVDTQSDHLHRKNVEIVTIYLGPASAREFAYYRGFGRELVLAAQAQYTRLASTKGLAFDTASFDPATAASLLQSSTHAIGRGATFGELMTP